MDMTIYQFTLCFWTGVAIGALTMPAIGAAARVLFGAPTTRARHSA